VFFRILDDGETPENLAFPSKIACVIIRIPSFKKPELYTK
jgi:hypothetical protein